MSEKTIELQDFLKSLPNTGDLTGLSVLCFNSSGEPTGSKASILQYHVNAPDIDAITTTGFYRPVLGVAGTIPPGISPNTSDLIIYSGTSAYGLMLYLPFNYPRLLRRVRLSGAWRDWMKLEFAAV